MTMLDPAAGDGVQAQVLIKLGELVTATAVIDTKLSALIVSSDDHERRIRALENAQASHDGGRDVAARVTAAIATCAAIGSAAAAYLHH
jgi:hypothetical protein